MLFLYRPRQTWMPYRLPRSRTEQAAYNRQLQDRYGATHRVPPAVPAPEPAPPPDRISQLKDLGELHRSGALTDDEFETAKAMLLAT